MKASQWIFVVLAGTTFRFGELPTTAFGDEPKSEKDVRRIPLDSIYSTNGQKGVKSVRQNGAYRKDLAQMHHKSIGHGASNIFLVSAKDIAGAVKATREVFIGARGADVPANSEDGPKIDKYWVVIYFGVTASEPPAWLVRSVEQQGNQVKVVYSRPKLFQMTRDLHQYFVWIPLGRLEEGTYALELFDADQMQVNLLRRVTVSKP